MSSKFGKWTVACALAIAVLGHGLAHAQSAEGRTDWPGPGQLFVGTCYQPFVRPQPRADHARHRADEAGRLQGRAHGHLSWDSFEPAEGRFEFQTFDGIMNRMHAAGIKVILDIPGQPAPTWLHHKYPASTSSPHRAGAWSPPSPTG